jgi:hypothetical protein
MPKLPWFYVLVYTLLAIGLGWVAVVKVLPDPGAGLITKGLVLTFMAGVLLAGFLSMMLQWRRRNR